MTDDSEPYANIREILGAFIGRKVVDITQHDPDEWAETKRSYVMLMFDDGNYLKFTVGEEGFDYSDDVEDSQD